MTRKPRAGAGPWPKPGAGPLPAPSSRAMMLTASTPEDPGRRAARRALARSGCHCEVLGSGSLGVKLVAHWPAVTPAPELRKGVAIILATSDESLGSFSRTLCTSGNVEAPVMDLLEAWTAGDAAPVRTGM